MTDGMKKALRKVVILLGWLVIWQVAAMLVNKPVLFASPMASLRSLLSLLQRADFYQTVLFSFGRIAAGFLTAFVSGLLVGALAWRFPLLAEFLSPMLRFMKSVPVASFIILVLVWFGSSRVTMIVSFFIVFPLIYHAAVSGLSAADPQLLEMAQCSVLAPGSGSLPFTGRP